MVYLSIGSQHLPSPNDDPTSHDLAFVAPMNASITVNVQNLSGFKPEDVISAMIQAKNKADTQGISITFTGITQSIRDSLREKLQLDTLDIQDVPEEITS